MRSFKYFKMFLGSLKHALAIPDVEYFDIYLYYKAIVPDLPQANLPLGLSTRQEIYLLAVFRC